MSYSELSGLFGGICLTLREMLVIQYHLSGKTVYKQHTDVVQCTDMSHKVCDM